GLVREPRFAQPRDDALASGGVSEPTDDCTSAPWARSSSNATSTPADGCEIAFPLSKCGWPFAGSRSGCGVATAVSPKKRLAIAKAVTTENAVLCLTADSPVNIVTHTMTTPDSVGRMPATRNYEEPVRRYQAPQQAVSPPLHLRLEPLEPPRVGTNRTRSQIAIPADQTLTP